MGPTIFYASGETGLNVRADGRGGSLARGWYIRTVAGLIGPICTKTGAKNHPQAENACVIAVNHRNTPESFHTA